LCVKRWMAWEETAKENSREKYPAQSCESQKRYARGLSLRGAGPLRKRKGVFFFAGHQT